jgi:hypothetical protein
LFSYKYWEVSFDFPILLGLQAKAVSALTLKVIETFFIAACIVLPIMVGVLRYFYARSLVQNTPDTVGLTYMITLQFCLLLCFATIFFLVNGLLRIKTCIKSYKHLQLNSRLMLY